MGKPSFIDGKYKALFVVSTILLVLQNVVPALAVEHQWKLLVDHAGFGRCSAIFSESKVRFDDGVLKRLILPPYDQSILFNTETKKVMKAGNETFRQMTGVNYAGSSVKKIGVGKMFGMNCTHYEIRFPRPGTVGDYWATSEIHMHPKLAVLCSELSAAPEGYGVPVKLVIKHKAAKDERIYQVVKLEKMPLNNKDFAAPQGFSKAHDLFELHFCEQGSTYKDAVDSAFMLPDDSLKNKKKRD